MFTFDRYFEWLIPWEGSVYENVPGDPGGPTKFGIDQASHPRVNIRQLTRAQAKAIYRRDYWNKHRCDLLQPRTSWVFMDGAVNNGAGQAALWLQRALGVNDDGRIGPVTQAAEDASDDRAIAFDMLAQREIFYRQIARKPKQGKFLKGWLNRNNSLRAALAL